MEEREISEVETKSKDWWQIKFQLFYCNVRAAKLVKMIGVFSRRNLVGWVDWKVIFMYMKRSQELVCLSSEDEIWSQVDSFFRAARTEAGSQHIRELMEVVANDLAEASTSEIV